MDEERVPRDGAEQDGMMVYIDPNVIHSMAAVSAKKRAGLQELQSAAESGDLEAEYRLGMCYYEGSGGAEQNDRQAFYWLDQAAEGGHIAAQYGAGLCWAGGVGTRQDFDRAAELYLAAAEQEYVPAICELGLCYEMGRGVPQDKDKAL